VTTKASEGLTEAQFTRFRELVRQRSGLEVGPRRRNDLEKAVVQALKDNDIADVASLYARFTDPAHGRPALESFIANLTIGETHFFRNRAQMEALEEVILPDLIERKQSLRRLRIWSAGCATGEEPYSVAILLERLIPDLANWNITILATDINRHAIERAQRGMYGSWSFREVPESIERDYFSEVDGRIEVLPRIRKLVTFGYLNLIEDAYPSLTTNTQSMDLILCRNVLIYFQESTTAKVVSRLGESLVDGGWLVVGAAEPSQQVFADFVVHNFPKTVVYQKKAGERGLAGSPKKTPAMPSAAAAAETAVRPHERTPAPNPVWPPKDAPTDRPAPPSEAKVARAPRVTGSLDEAKALIDAGDKDEALAMLIGLAHAGPEASYEAFLVAKLYASRLQLYEAEHWINIAIERDSLLAPAHYVSGLILQEYGRMEGALASLRRCNYADPEFALGHFALAGLLHRLGQQRRAQKELENVQRILETQDPEALVPEGDGLTVGRLRELLSL
jgi:chemotaxis protein methyltransferase CheR